MLNKKYKLFFKFFLLTFLVNVISGQHHWETAIFASDEWKYITPNIELSSNWNALDFDDSGWSSSQGGFGYGDGDDGTIIDPSISVFLRKERKKKKKLGS